MLLFDKTGGIGDGQILNFKYYPPFPVKRKGGISKIKISSRIESEFFDSIRENKEFEIEYSVKAKKHLFLAVRIKKSKV